jgi:Domain of unknown function (DUF4291)
MMDCAGKNEFWMARKVYCAFDDEGVFVYMALNPSIVQMAVDQGNFGKNFAFDLTRWIKPNFAWMLNRTYGGERNRRLAIASVKIHHWAWLEMLTESVLSRYDDEVHGDRMIWQNLLKRSKVIAQWDRDCAFDGKPMDQQGIQLGLKATILPDFVARYVISVTDVSPLASNIAQQIKSGRSDFPPVPEEREYPLEEALAKHLGVLSFDPFK